MAELQAVTSERHRARFWQKTPTYLFAKQDTVITLGTNEFPQAMLSMALGFFASGEGYVPVAVQGLAANQNLFVAKDGRWLGGYIPAAYRSHPFRLAQNQAGEHVLCIDEASALITEGPSGERFFTEDGKPSAAVSEIFSFLMQMEKNRINTHTACQVLQQHELIEPWPIKVQGDGESQTLAGLYRISEEKLNVLPAEGLLALRDARALHVAYSQLMSMQHIQQLGKLADTHARVGKAAEKTPKAPALGIFDNNGIISFDNLG